MGVDIQSDAGIGMPHQVLQTLHIKSCLLNIGAKGVPQHMGRHPRNGVFAGFLKFALNPSHIVLQVHGYLWHPRLVQKQETTVSVHQQFYLGRYPVFHHPLQGQVDSIRHGNRSNAAFGLGSGDEIGLLRCSA